MPDPHPHLLLILALAVLVASCLSGIEERRWLETRLEWAP